MSKKIRLDVYLTSKGLVNSRQKAQRYILAGKVKDKNGKILDKPGQQVLFESEINISLSPQFVSRGGEKLSMAFKKFPINVKDRVCMDVGISTGGFTDCLLQNGAKLIYGIDVGYGQTSWKIRNIPSKKFFSNRFLIGFKTYFNEINERSATTKSGNSLLLENITEGLRYLIFVLS